MQEPQVPPSAALVPGPHLPASRRAAAGEGREYFNIFVFILFTVNLHTFVTAGTKRLYCELPRFLLG